ncbi:hypothetical protein SAMN05216410_2671 [Sanguibacter gelidistatuariae]|uniref:Uncharacterized protein n=1 Tax=Sanguibacter gelidistatuariae TaxID=1814289 RepID=A0A1G6RFA5_9MICO|nr:hypothetical protein [Sanguibacter gelidistatuariae]SDD03063.1 hypothetical protein SAMN05216410_2671 [Sanguibacter gelidistatuariae]
MPWAAPAVAAGPSEPARPAPSAAPDCDGVSVVVDFGALSADGIRGCAPLAPDASVSALEAVLAAGVSVEGTTQWGTAFVCRVDGRPGAAEEIQVPDGGTVRESCSRTPSQQAYWSLWHADGHADGHGGGVGEWLYATTGAGDLTVTAGDVVGLVFTTGLQAATAPSLPTSLARSGDLPGGWVDREPPGTDPGEPDGTASTGTASTPAAPGDQPTGDSGGQGAGLVPLLAVGILLAGGVGAAVVARRRR